MTGGQIATGPTLPATIRTLAFARTETEGHGGGRREGFTQSRHDLTDVRRFTSCCGKNRL